MNFTFMIILIKLKHRNNLAILKILNNLKILTALTALIVDFDESLIINSMILKK